MRYILPAVLCLLFAMPVGAGAVPQTEEQKTLYSIGQVIARQLEVFSLTPAEFDMVRQGINDGMTGKALVEAETYKQKIQQLATARRDAHGVQLAAQSKDFLDKAAQEKGAVKTSSGLIYLPVKEGNGTAPTANDGVKVNYRGTLIDGKEFDSSYRRGQPGEFALSGVIPCWSEGLQLMKPGGKAKLVCPAELAYGKRGAGTIPGDATLVFEVELLEVKKK